MSLTKEELRDLRKAVRSASQSNTQNLYKAVGMALGYLKYQEKARFLWKYDPNGNGLEKLESKKEARVPGQSKNLYLESIVYTRTEDVMFITTIYYSSRSLENGNAELFLVRSKIDWGIKREIMSKEALI